MALLVDKSLDTAKEIKECFGRYNRDYFPLPVYEFILNYYADWKEEYIELDPTYWCNKISAKSLSQFRAWEGNDKLQLKDFIKELEKHTTVITTDVTNTVEMVYYLKY